MKQALRIATRKSRLALWQAEHVASCLKTAHPALDIELVPIVTSGDRAKDARLASIGGKGLFVKELEHALLRDKADVAVHSMKDVPTELPEGMCIGAALERFDSRDVLVSNHYSSFSELPSGARVGTSSLRRQSQLKHLRAEIEILPLRGNVDTRLRKLDEGDYDAIVLANAGLSRLGLADRVTEHLSAKQCLPAIGQGIIGIECCEDKCRVRELLRPLEHSGSRRCLEAERAVAAGLRASCHSPVAAAATIEHEQISLSAIVALPDGSELVRAAAAGDLDQAVRLGSELAEDLLARGAADILRQIEGQTEGQQENVPGD